MSKPMNHCGDGGAILLLIVQEESQNNLTIGQSDSDLLVRLYSIL